MVVSIRHAEQRGVGEEEQVGDGVLFLGAGAPAPPLHAPPLVTEPKTGRHREAAFRPQLSGTR
jgi:hypothetical protein